jgi:hypothetical protein
MDSQLYIQPENRALITQLRQYLMERDGIPVSRVLSELDNLSQKQLPPVYAGGGTLPQPPQPPAPIQDNAALEPGRGEPAPTEQTGRRRKRSEHVT